MKSLFFVPGPVPDRIQLSQSEKRLLAIIVATAPRGAPAKEIAHRLGLKLSTVHVTIFRLSKALGVGGKIGLSVWAIAHPEAFSADAWVEISFHPQGCDCEATHCANMRGLLDLVA